MSTTVEQPKVTDASLDADRRRSMKGLRRAGAFLALVLGALLCLFPFYYMVVGSFQSQPDPRLSGAFPDPTNLTFDNFVGIHASIDLLRTLTNSVVFTGGVILLTLMLGLLAGYALAVLNFRGRGVLFGAIMLSLVLPFQLLMIPLYVMIVRAYGLADSYLGMILPFAVNPTAVFIFRQFFRSIPVDLFDAARLDGGSELQVLRHVAVPMAKPAILTAVLVTFIGPWNEFLWPFLITKQASMQPLAVALANFISTVAAAAANPFGAILAGATVLAAPAVLLFLLFQKQFTDTDIGSSLKE